MVFNSRYTEEHGEPLENMGKEKNGSIQYTDPDTKEVLYFDKLSEVAEYKRKKQEDYRKAA